MFRVRDHIISLVAVFLALGVGILIGTGMSDDMLVTQQRLLIEQMTKDYRELREERRVLEARLQGMTRDLYLWEKYQEALYPGVVAGALSGKRISLICHGTEVPESILRLLQDADGILCNVLVVDERQALGTDTSGLGAALAALSVQETITPEMEAYIQPYLTEQKIRIDIMNNEQPEIVILVLGGRQQADRRIVDELIATLPQDRFLLVGLEQSDITDSLLQQLKAAGISTIDNADTVFGQFSLLAVLRGSSGSYGIKQTADEFIANF